MALDKAAESTRRRTLSITIATGLSNRVLVMRLRHSSSSRASVIMEALRQEQTTVLFIEHDMEIVERYVARVLAFSQGEIICDAPTAEAMEHPKVRELVIGEKKSSGNGADGHV